VERSGPAKREPGVEHDRPHGRSTDRARTARHQPAAPHTAAGCNAAFERLVDGICKVSVDPLRQLLERIGSMVNETLT